MVALLIKSRYDAQRAVYEQPFSDGGQKIPFPQDFIIRISYHLSPLKKASTNRTSC